LLALAIMFVGGCGKIVVVPSNSRQIDGYLGSGTASVYASTFAGKRTASGEVFQIDSMTAAHRTLPFGTYLRVVNKHNGRDVVVRVNDRGPNVPGRLIDLSPRAAKAIGFDDSGLVSVEIFKVQARASSS
jgi:rare lipoprotein A